MTIPLRLIRVSRIFPLASGRYSTPTRAYSSVSRSHRLSRTSISATASKNDGFDNGARSTPGVTRRYAHSEGSTFSEGPSPVHLETEPEEAKPKPRKTRSRKKVEAEAEGDTASEPLVSPRPKAKRASKKARSDDPMAIPVTKAPSAARKKSSASKNTTEQTLTWDLGTGAAQEEVIKIEESPPLTDTESIIAAEMQRALIEQRIPNTELAKFVYKNYLRFPGCIVLTRVGKFYESYYDAALHLTSIIDIKIAVKRNNVLWTQETNRRKPKNGNSQLQFPFAGFPYTHIDKYLKILVQDLGHTVVLVEEDRNERKDAAGLVRRSVGRVVTPGTLLDESWLNGSESRYLLAISVSDTAGSATDGSIPLWLAYTDVSTGEFFSKDTTLAKLEDELTRIGPREVVLDRSFAPYWTEDNVLGTRDDHSTIGELFSLLRVLNPHISFADTYIPPEIDGSPAKAMDRSVLDANLEAQALSLLRHYVQYALREYSPDLSEPQRQFDSAFMHIDAATLNGLEIKHSMRISESNRASPLTAKGTLLSTISHTVTPSGHRLLVRTLSAPSTSIPTINDRLDLVQAFVERGDLRVEVQDTFKPLKDVVKLFQRIRRGRGEVDDVYEIANWIEGVKTVCDRVSSEVGHERSGIPEGAESPEEVVGRNRLDVLVESIHDLSALAKEIHRVIDADIVTSLRRATFASSSAPEDDDDIGPLSDSADSDIAEIAEIAEEVEAASDSDVEDVDEDAYPQGMTKANIALLERFRKVYRAFDQQWWIKPSASPKLRELHDMLEANEKRRKKLEEKLVKRFGVAEKDICAIVPHEIIGWKLLVSKASDRAKMTADGEMREFGGGAYSKFLECDPVTVLGHERDRIASELKQEQDRVYMSLRRALLDSGELLIHNAGVADDLDVAMSFAQLADDMGYVRPTLTDGTEFQVLNGRHPVVESALHSSARLFVPNSNSLTEENHLHIITGPNQGGKSTFLRQTAVIAILAQSGSFVPADEAVIGIVDQLFSRIGARDDLFRDRSTFMLEMVETAAILRYATKRSLVIMDEIGRGTTLQAGMAIAYATLDYILGNIGCRTLFATHYHELAAMLKEQNAEGEVVGRKGIEYWCTDVDEADEAVSYSYRLKPGVNYDSHAILAARLAGMPPAFMAVAREKLEELQRQKDAGRLL